MIKYRLLGIHVTAIKVEKHCFLLQVVHFGAPNSPKIGQGLNSTVQSALLKYALAIGVDYGQTDVSLKSQIGLTPATSTEWSRSLPLSNEGEQLGY